MKKIIALIMSLCIFGNIGFAFDAQSLSQFGLNVSSDSQELALRKDFVANIVNFAGLAHLSDSEQVFSDVAPEHKDYGAIMAAYHASIIYGNDDLEFLPDVPVTYEEAINIFIRLLGYDVYLNQGMDYRMIAASIGLIDGLEIKDPKAWLNHGAMEKLFSNAISIPTLEMDYENGKYTYNENGKTILEKYRKAGLKEGLVQSVGDYTIEQNAKTYGDHIIIGGQTYNTNGKDFSSYLGMYVECLYIEQNGVNVILSISPVKKCTVTEITLSAIMSLDGTLIEYKDDSNKTRKVRLDKNVAVTYNGTPISTFGASLFAGDNGKIKFINNNNDSTIDVVIIEEYEDIFVGNIDTVNEIIYDKYRKTSGGAAVSVKLSSLDEEDFVSSNNKPVDIKKLQRETLVSVLKTDTGVPVKAIVCNKVEEGIITDINKSKNTIVVAGKEYYVTDVCMANYTLRVGDSVEMYINANGYVGAVISAGAGNVEFGYIMNMAYDIDEERIFAWILTKDNEQIRFNVNKKFTLNGVRDAHQYDATRAVFEDANGFLPQLVRYALGTDRSITMLDNEGSANEAGSPSLVSIYDKTSSMRYTSGGSSFSSKLIVDGAVIFQVPDEEEASKRGTYNKEKYKVISPSNLINNRNYSVAAYSTDPKEFVADAFVVYDTTSTGTGMYDGETLAVISGLAETIDDEGEVVPLIEYYYKGEKYEHPVESLSVVEDALESARESNPTLQLSIGDAIRLELNENSQISYMHYVYSISDGTDDTLASLSGYHSGSVIPNSELNKYDYFTISLGHIYKIINGNAYFAKKSIIQTGAELGLDNLAAYKADSVPVIVYDPNNDTKVTTATLNELTESSGGVAGEFVLIKTYLGALQFIYVIRN